jgi:hypothetical protein
MTKLRWAVIFAGATALGMAAGFALGIFFYPYIFLADIVGAEAVDKRAAGRLVARGTFIHANPRDPVHYGKGRASVYEGLVHLESDFEVGPGPKFHVYLVPERQVLPATAVDKTMYVDLGRLKAFRGSQNYAVPAGVDLLKYGSVVIWCERFGVLISPATLKQAQ